MAPSAESQSGCNDPSREVGLRSYGAEHETGLASSTALDGSEAAAFDAHEAAASVAGSDAEGNAARAHVLDIIAHHVFDFDAAAHMWRSVNRIADSAVLRLLAHQARAVVSLVSSPEERAMHLRAMFPPPSLSFPGQVSGQQASSPSAAAIARHGSTSFISSGAASNAPQGMQPPPAVPVPAQSPPMLPPTPPMLLQNTAAGRQGQLSIQATATAAAMAAATVPAGHAFAWRGASSHGVGAVSGGRLQYAAAAPPSSAATFNWQPSQQQRPASQAPAMPAGAAVAAVAAAALPAANATSLLFPDVVGPGPCWGTAPRQPHLGGLQALNRFQQQQRVSLQWADAQAADGSWGAELLLNGTLIARSRRWPRKQDARGAIADALLTYGRA